jgi:AraC-like DNA-binding protein
VSLLFLRGCPAAFDAATPGEIAELRTRATRVTLPGFIDDGAYYRPRADIAGPVELVGVLRYHEGTTRDWQWHRLPEGNAFLLYTRGVRDGAEFSRLLAVGPRSLAHVDPVAYAQIVAAARFRVGLTADVFRACARQLADDAIDVDALWGAEGRALHRRLDEARSDEELAVVLERALAARIAGTPWDPIGAPAAALVLARQGRIDLAELERRVGYSRRHLRRRFEETIGLSPKRLGRIARFRAVVERAGRAGRPDWCALAAEHGFADQSHLIAECRALTGYTPTDLLGHEHFEAIRTHDTILRRR